jgi:hypothetical protein
MLFTCSFSQPTGHLPGHATAPEQAELHAAWDEEGNLKSNKVQEVANTNCKKTPTSPGPSKVQIAAG